jgi:hypothetical protein
MKDIAAVTENTVAFCAPDRRFDVRTGVPIWMTCQKFRLPVITMSDVASEPCGPTHSELSLDIASLIHDQARLPLDLERRVFDLAAHSRPRNIPLLMLVARRVQNWYV